MSSLEQYLERRRALVEEALDRFLPSVEAYPRLIHEAMRYSVFARGKRLRPILTIASAEAVGGTQEDALPVAAALECIHTYSLIHDDLPSMDNDEFRRGKPTCHKVYGEALAILAGDALLTLAFSLLSQEALARKLGAERLSLLIQEVAKAAGSLGMVGGQVVDILSEGREVDRETLRYLHTHKTGALIRASVLAGALVASASKDELEALSRYGERVGLAFQIVDDLLDITGKQEEMGKPVGGDRRKRKATYPELLGQEESRRQVEKLINEAKEALTLFGELAWALRSIADYIGARRY